MLWSCIQGLCAPDLHATRFIGEYVHMSVCLSVSLSVCLWCKRSVLAKVNAPRAILEFLHLSVLQYVSMSRHILVCTSMSLYECYGGAYRGPVLIKVITQIVIGDFVHLPIFLSVRLSVCMFISLFAS